jgi:protein SCO1
VNPRARLVLLVIAAVALPTAVFAAFAGRSHDSGSAAIVEDLDVSGSRSSPFKGAVRPPAPAADFALRDQNGDLVQLSGLRGKVVVLSPLYTHCRDTCPLTAQQIRGALDDLDTDVPVVAVSVDPKNDTESNAKRFLVEQQMIGRMHFALGTTSALKRQWDAYGIAPQRDGREHSAYVVLVDGSGMQRIGWPVDRLTPEGLAHDIRELQAGETT